jgi:hypothetical protein
LNDQSAKWLAHGHLYARVRFFNNAGLTNERIDHMAWALLSVAGVLEIAVAFGMKWAEGFTRFPLGRQIDLLDQLNG